MMEILADTAAPDLALLLEAKGFKSAENSREHVSVYGNVEVCDRPITVRFDSPMTSDSAIWKLRSAGYPQEVIDSFLFRNKRAPVPSTEAALPPKQPSK